LRSGKAWVEDIIRGPRKSGWVAKTILKIVR
jgi:hypothetical protein